MNKALTSTLLLLLSSSAFSETLFSINDLVFQGATRISLGTYGDSRMAYTEGTFSVSEDETSIFVVGHSQHQAIAEFFLPELAITELVTDLPMAKNKQPFASVFDRVPTGNPDSINRITGLRHVNDKLILNAVQYYDGDANNTDTTLVVEQPHQLDSSPITGFLKLNARSHSSGWMTKLPTELQDAFQGNYIFGYASNYAINARNSMGPSAFGVKLDNILNLASGEEIPTYPLIDYSITNPLAQDLYNESGNNDLWTEVSAAYVGFVVPGTDTYAVFGTSGGHNSGIGYKITQDNGYQCGGPCPYRASDVYNYYWFFKVSDMISVAEKQISAHEVKPYEYGEIKLPFQDQSEIPKLLIGANFNQNTNTLYFMLGNADTLQNQYESAPLLLSYTINRGNRPTPPASIKIE